MAETAVKRLVVGQLLKKPGAAPARTRILWISADGKRAATFRIDRGGGFPSFESAQDLEDDLEHKRLVVDDEHPVDEVTRKLVLAIGIAINLKVSPPVRVSYEQNWSMIKDFVINEPACYDDSSRQQAIKAICKTHKTTRPTLVLLLRKYWGSGKVAQAVAKNVLHMGNAGQTRRVLKRRKRGAKAIYGVSGINVTRLWQARIRESIKHVTTTKNLADAYKLFLTDWFKTGTTTRYGDEVNTYRPPSRRINERQYRYWIKRLVPPVELAAARLGQQNAVLTERAQPGKAGVVVSGPGAVYEIDSTVIDDYVVSRIDRRVIGRPILYVVIDVYSRMVVGIYLAFDGPNYECAAAALMAAAEDKVAFCARYGVKIKLSDWPSHFLPSTIVADGGELNSEMANQIVDGLGARLVTLPGNRGDWKTFVEKYFHISKEKSVKWSPATIDKRNKERNKKAPAGQAVFTIDEMMKKLIQGALWYNNDDSPRSLPDDRLLLQTYDAPTRLQVFNWGMTHRTGALQIKPPDVIRAALLPVSTATVTKHGVMFNSKPYFNDRAAKEQWMQSAASNKPWDIPISYDRRSMDQIYWSPKGRSKKVEVFTLRKDQQDAPSYLFEEVASHATIRSRSLAQQKQLRLTRDLQLMDTNKVVEKQATKATKSAAASQESATKRMKGMAGRRSITIAEERLAASRANTAAITGRKEPVACWRSFKTD